MLKQEQKKNSKLFGFGAVVGLTCLSIALASVPRKGMITDDTAMYQRLSEIHVARESDPNFDGDIARLSRIESSYKEKNLPLKQHRRVKAPLERVSKKKYHYQSASQ